MQLEIRQKSDIRTKVWDLPVDVCSHCLLNMLHLFEARQVSRRRRSWEAAPQTIEVQHRGAIRGAILLELDKYVFPHAGIVGTSTLVPRHAENDGREVNLIGP